MKRAKVFSRRAIRVPSVIEPDRTDRQFVTQAAAERVAHVVNAGLFGSGKQVAGVKKECALKLAVNRKRVFDVEDGIEFAADRISFGIMRAEVALTETAHSGSATVEEPLVDWQSGRSEEHTSELQSHHDLVCRLLLEKKKKKIKRSMIYVNTMI